MTVQTSKINSICILRLSAIGDVTHILPVIATLQKAISGVQITWVIGKLEYKLMQGLVGVNFVIFDKKAGRKGYKDLKNELKNQTFDVLMQMQYSFRANRAAWKIKAKQRIGFDKKRSRELHSYRLTHRINAVEQQHVLDGFMEFVKVLGVKEIIYKWNIFITKSDNEFAKQFINADKKNVIISPCSSNKLRNWSNKSYAKIIDFIGEKYHANIIICGSPSQYEIDTAKKITDLCVYPLTDITGKDTLKQLYALMSMADLILSPDSGPMHIANAAGTPVIGLHAATTAKRSGAYSYPELAVDCFDQAAKEILKISPDDIRWGGQITQQGVMDLITVKMIEKKVDLILAEKH